MNAPFWLNHGDPITVQVIAFTETEKYRAAFGSTEIFIPEANWQQTPQIKITSKTIDISWDSLELSNKDVEYKVYARTRDNNSFFQDSFQEIQCVNKAARGN